MRAETLTPADAVLWRGADVEIECAPLVLRAVCADAARGYAQLRHGGLEIGGILVGRREGNSVHISNSQTVRCEYRFGPSFVLSDADKTALAQSLERFAAEAGPSPLEPVGCYFSHTRHGPELTAGDVEVWNRFFPAPHQIALVLVPGTGTSTQVNVFQRDGKGAPVRIAQFDRAPALDSERTLFKKSRLGDLAAPAPEEIRSPLEPILFAPEPAANRNRTWIGRVVLMVILITLAAAAAFFELGWPPGVSSQASLSVPIRLEERGHQLNIRWGAIPVRDDMTASVEIKDGAELVETQLLGPRELRAGEMSYARKSGTVEVRFALEREGRAISTPSTAIYISPAGENVADNVASLRPPAPLAAPVEQRAPSVPPAQPDQPQPRKFSASLPVPPAAQPPAPLVALPDAPAIPSGVTPLLSTTLPKASGPSAPQPPPAARRNVPQSGRLIWTGRIESHGSLWIANGRASSGSVNGSLPGVPITIQIHPAELTDEGIVVFTQNRVAGPEEPGPQNGWNPVSYQTEPKRVSDLSVRELPGPSNGWNRVIVATGSRAVSMLVLDWRSTE